MSRALVLIIITGVELMLFATGMLWYRVDAGRHSDDVVIDHRSHTPNELKKLDNRMSYLMKTRDNKRTFLQDCLAQVTNEVHAPVSLAERTRTKFPGGEGFIDIGDFRLGVVNEQYFAIVRGTEPLFIATYTGTIVELSSLDAAMQNTVREFGHRSVSKFGRAVGVTTGDRFIEFNQLWRLGEFSGDHLSLAHASGQTSLIFVRSTDEQPGQVVQLGQWALGVYKNKLYIEPRGDYPVYFVSAKGKVEEGDDIAPESVLWKILDS